MGVLRLFRLIVNKYPNCLINLRGSYDKCDPVNLKETIDWIEYDLNSIFHPVIQELHQSKLKSKSLLRPSKPPSPVLEKPENILFQKICERIENIRKIFRPSKGLYLAIDGTAGMSKCCILKGTPVSMSTGTSKHIEDLKCIDNVWGWNGSGFSCTSNKGLESKGLKNTCEIILADGRKLITTPDHEILINRDKPEWIKAEKLQKFDNIIMGVELPLDEIGSDEVSWKLEINNVILDMGSNESREKVLAFARIVGLVITDGHLSNKKSRGGAVSVGTKLDAKQFQADVYRVVGKNPRIRDVIGDKGRIFAINLPRSLVDLLLQLKGMPVGKRVIQPASMPEFIIDQKCPLSVIREFLGGMFGGDGCSPTLVLKGDIFSGISFVQSICETHIESMKIYMAQLKSLLSRFELNFRSWKPQPHTYYNGKMVPKDKAKNPRLKFTIITPNSLKFGEKIGFRYAINKQLRLSIVMSYSRLQEGIKNQRKIIVSRAIEIFKMTPTYQCPHCMFIFSGRTSLTRHMIERCKIKRVKSVPRSKPCISQALKMSWEEFTDPILHQKSLSSVGEVIRISNGTFPSSIRRIRGTTTASEFLRITGTYNWFASDETVAHAVSQESTEIPNFLLPILEIRPGKKCEVYDIEVEENHSFLANGCCVHNCQQRKRRFKTVMDKNITTTWDSTKLSCGTIFMDRLGNYINNFVQEQVRNNAEWGNLEIIISDASIPSEGEHKLLNHMRSFPSSSYGIVSPDADLIFLACGLHKTNSYIFRENIFDDIDSDFFLVDVQKFRRCIIEEIGLHDEKNELKLNRHIEDFIVYCFSIGNDFLPSIPSINLANDGIQELFGSYKQMLTYGYISEQLSTGEFGLCKRGIKEFMTQLASREEKMLIHNYIHNQARKADSLMKKHLIVSNSGDEVFDFETYRTDYYKEKFHGVDREIVVREYLRGMTFVLRYYLETIPSWNYSYPFSYAPLFRDIADYLDDINFTFLFDLSSPFTPFEQLLAILPPESAYLLPEPLQFLLTSAESPICDFYPRQFGIDSENKKNDYESVILLPHVDPDRIRSAFRSIESRLSVEDRERNRVGNIYVYGAIGRQ